MSASLPFLLKKLRFEDLEQAYLVKVRPEGSTTLSDSE
jgi:hypothetical protein